MALAQLLCILLAFHFWKVLRQGIMFTVKHPKRISQTYLSHFTNNQSTVFYVYYRVELCLYVVYNDLNLIIRPKSISRDNGAVYFAVVLMGSCLGPAFGFIGGALQLGVWTEGDDKKPEGITSADPGWVGAWWIGFLVCGFASILCALPMFGFPKERF